MDWVACLPNWLARLLPSVCRVALCRSFLLAAIIMPAVAFPQADSASLPGDEPQREQRILDRIDQIELDQGADSPALIEPLIELMLLLEERDDDGSAVGVVERVRQIVRTNYGPQSLRQAPLLRRLIDYEERRGDFQAAWILEAELLDLAERNADDLASVPILHEIADKRMDMVRRFIAGDAPPQIYLGCYYDWSRQHDIFGECYSGSRSEAISAVISDAQSIYASAVGVILDNEAYSSEELRQLEGKLLWSNYAFQDTNSYQGLHAHNPYPLASTKWRERMGAVYELAGWGFPESYFESPLEQARPRERDGTRGEWHRMASRYHVGRLSLQRQLAYAIDTQASLPEQAEALVQIADWDLVHGQNGLAIEGYALAFAKLEQLDAEPTLLESLFFPEAPVMLPSFDASASSPREPATSDAWIEVRFELTKYGRSRGVELVDASSPPEVMDGMAAALVNRLKGARFRPQTRDGRFAEPTTIQARYPLD